MRSVEVQVNQGRVKTSYTNGALKRPLKNARRSSGAGATATSRTASTRSSNVFIIALAETVIKALISFKLFHLKFPFVDTLPPYLTSTMTPNITNNVTNLDPKQNQTKNSTIETVESQGEQLIFKETEKEKPETEFMFAQNNTFIQIDGDTIKTFQLRLCREISFQFRTRLPHGLLVYHNVKNPEGIELDPYALYVIVEKGQLKVVHVFGKHSTSVIVGEGLNREEWHSVTVRIDVHGARLIARVDNSQEEVYLKGLNHDTNYGVSTNLPSVVLVGGKLEPPVAIQPKANCIVL